MACSPAQPASGSQSSCAGLGRSIPLLLLLVLLLVLLLLVLVVLVAA